MLEWLEIARNQAEERYRSLPLPSAKNENFRFSKLELPEGQAVSNEGEKVPVELSSLDEEEGALLSLHGEDSSFFGLAPGALFTDMLRAAVLGSDLMRARFKDSTLFAQDKFAQLTAARWRNGVFLHVPAGVKLEKPLRATVMASGSEDHSRNLFLLEEGAEATFIFESFSAESNAFSGELTEIRLGRGAKLHLVVLQRFSSNTTAVIRQRAEIGEGAELRVTPFHLGGAATQVRLESILAEEASLELVGAARGDSSQQFDFWLDADHQGSRSKSEMSFSFVMGDSSKAVFNGLIQIRPQAADCVASQKSKSLLLGLKATVHAIPKLIIQTDAVKCSHGASVSNVNPEQIHYLQSRGIPKVEAERMVVRGFTEPVLDRFPMEGLHGRAEAALDKKEGWLQ